MDNKKNGIPKLRFPGFTGAWEQRKFSEFATYSGKRNKDNLDLEPYAITSDNGFIRQSEAHNEFGYMKNTDRAAYKIVQSNSFGYNPARINIGSIGYYSGNKNIIVSSLYEVFKTNQDVNDDFLWVWFKSNRFQEWVNKLQEGSVRLYFYYDKLRETKIQLPNLEEQSQVADLFTNLDSLITLHQRKLEHLQEQKKGLLQKMFPKNGETVPEVRFPGFTDAWEQRKLGEIGKVFTGNTPSTKNTENWTTDKSIGHVWITPTDINNNIMFDSERYLSDKGWSQARVVPKNSVLITSIASIGKNAINGVEVAFNQQINALVVQKNNPYFILTLMNKEKQRFESLAGQTATPIINKSTFSSFMVKIPSETEQEQIGEFFKQLDFLITLHQRKLEHLELMKKGLLQQMFV